MTEHQEIVASPPPDRSAELLVKGLKPKVKVKFRVVAENKVGANPSIVVSAKPKK